MQEEEQALDRIRIQGRVKWFDPVKGFGFIVADSGGADILLHANVLRNFGQGSVADGAGIDVFIQKTARGAQAVEIVAIRPPEGMGVALSEDLTPEQIGTINDLPIEAARVKWFDKGKGFGFANVFGRAEDVFVHIEVLRQSGFADLQPGEAVGLRIIEGKRGRMAVQVLSWEAALRKAD
ncbi:MAG: cold shock domain-containing protein [Gemmobacter sp.]|jgi:cold shock protein|nr:cold shock domain-containing protein [Gemmobacter sp.]